MNLLVDVGMEEWTRHPFVARLNRYIALTESDHKSLRRLIENELTVEKRRDLVVDGYEYRKLCFVADGFGARYKLLRNGKRQILNVILPGDVVGLPGSFLDRASYSVIALTEMRIHVCSIDAYVQLCYRRPQFGLALSWLAVHEAAHYAERVVDTGRRTPPERLAHFLLELHSRLATIGRAEASELRSSVLPGGAGRRARPERAAPQSHAVTIALRRPGEVRQSPRGISRSRGDSIAGAVPAAQSHAHPPDRLSAARPQPRLPADSSTCGFTTLIGLPAQ